MATIRSIFLKKILLPIADTTMRTKVSFYYDLINNLQLFHKNDIIEWQNEMLRELLEHAYKNTKYYYRLFNKLYLSPSDFRSVNDLQKLPILTKEVIRNNFNDLIASNIKKDEYIKSSTGGSSGDPLQFYLDKKSWSFATANSIFNWEKVGYCFGDKYITLGSSSLFVNKKKSFKHELYYKIKRKIGLDGINMSDTVCESYTQFIKKNNVKYIYGYASSIYLLAKYVIKKNITINIVACFPTSEMLLDKYREVIEKAFSCHILDGYGAGDGGITAFEHKPGYYEVGYNTIVRIENNSSKKKGAALLTDLFNYAMPLINYQIGDILEIDDEKNRDNQYNGQIINRVLGRTSEIIELENGNILTGPGFTILFKDLPVEYYLIEKIGINTIKCSIIMLPEYSKKHKSIILSTLKKHSGNNSSVIIEYITEPLLTKSGKRKYFKSN